MFDRFTDHARHVMSFAYSEARERGHEHIGPEHLLLGLLRESCMASAILENLGIDLVRSRDEFGLKVGLGTEKDVARQLPFSAGAKAVLAATLEEVSDLGHDYVGTEHFLLGLIRARVGSAARHLRDAEVTSIAVLMELRSLRGDRDAGGGPDDIAFHPEW